LYLVEDVRPGDLLTVTNLRAIRPGMGLPPKYYHELLGRRVAVAAAKGTPMSWELLEPRETAE
jgi:N-acetylneuraminate synthase